MQIVINFIKNCRRALACHQREWKCLWISVTFAHTKLSDLLKTQKQKKFQEKKYFKKTKTKTKTKTKARKEY
jgi:hypothetical protein